MQEAKNPVLPILPANSTLTGNFPRIPPRPLSRNWPPISASHYPASASSRPPRVFIDGKKAAPLRGATLTSDFKQMVVECIERRFGHRPPEVAEALEVIGT